MTLKRMDNVGIVVESLDAAIAFFAELGLKLEGRATIRQPDSYRLKVILALAYFTPLAILQFALPFWPCPSCGKPFFGGWRSDAFLRFFTTTNRTCTHCGSPWPM